MSKGEGLLPNFHEHQQPGLLLPTSKGTADDFLKATVSKSRAGSKKHPSGNPTIPSTKQCVHIFTKRCARTAGQFHEDNFSMNLGKGRGWFGNDSSALHLLCTLFLLLLHQLHLRESGIRSQRLGAPELKDTALGSTGRLALEVLE